MLRPVFRVMGIGLLLAFASPALYALPGDAAAVLAHCGPASSDQVLRPSNGPQERILTYNSLALRFQPAEGDWSFFAASNSGVPLAQADAAKRLPCLGDAMEEVAARPPRPVGEPYVAESQQPAAKAESRNNLFLLIVGVVFVGILFFAIRPYTKSVPKAPQPAEAPRAPRRRPSATGIAAQSRRPADPPSSGPRRAAAALQEEASEATASPEETNPPHQS